MAVSVLPQDIEARWRPLSRAEADVAQTLIDSALVQLAVKRPRAMALANDGGIPQRLVVDAVCEAVQRVLRNPDLLRGQNITGDGGVGVTFGLGEDTNHALPRLRFSDEDLIVLDEAVHAVAPVARVGSVRLIL